VPGPVQDRLLVAVGRARGEEPQEIPLKTRIYTDNEKRGAIFRAFKVSRGSFYINLHFDRQPLLDIISTLGLDMVSVASREQVSF
jgi:hypothetical protein